MNEAAGFVFCFNAHQSGTSYQVLWMVVSWLKAKRFSYR